MQNSYANNNDIQKVSLECSYEMGDEIGHDILLIDTKNKSVKNMSNGEMFEVTSFDDYSIVYIFKYEAISMTMSINRKTGKYIQAGSFGGNRWIFNGECKKSSNKNLF